MHFMEFIKVYKCLCDGQRLRILNLLKEGPLCVCHLVEILAADQVKISKQLRYMKELGMVRGEREAQWMIYQLQDKPHPVLIENLKCLQDLSNERSEFATDLRKRTKILQKIQSKGSACPGAVVDSVLSSCGESECC
ncbi:MAG: ArsR family transcriptional regulator [Limisphaerales bacterium]|jgi:ArsR family transcriptional regulator